MNMFTKIFMCGAVCLVAGCTDEKESSRTLKAMGFTEVQMTGYDWFSCSEEDTFHTGFRAKNFKGETVEGVVCCGWLKNCTVRF